MTPAEVVQVIQITLPSQQNWKLKKGNKEFIDTKFMKWIVLKYNRKNIFPTLTDRRTEFSETFKKLKFLADMSIKKV